MHMEKDILNPGLYEDLKIGGYVIRQMVWLTELGACYYALEHVKSGARHIHISRADAENSFSVVFKTVPRDSSGVAHILEHTVLCGSRRFPVRDPFFSMLKRSLSTFMNALTASDWTMYPFATQNNKDFYNLMAVYLDATFYPNLNELSFRQEGHRLEIDGDLKDDAFALTYKGVVYNEMKGAMSAPDQVLVRSLLNALYPDSAYRHNSGGDPQNIPELTLAQLVAFHRRHYHPSNAYFYTYGNLPLTAHLQFVEEKVLSRFERIDPKTHISSQPRWKTPAEAAYPYPLSADEDPQKKNQVCLAWLVVDITDSFEVLTLVLLQEILLGNAASPLRKALIDSGLGTALSDGSGFDADNRDTLFACGLKDVTVDSAPEIEKIILEVLEGLYKNGIKAKLIDTAIHQLEFHHKEVTNTPYPYGLKLLMSFVGAWIHGGDPTQRLQLETDLKRLQEARTKSAFFEERINRYFLQNPHRVRFLLSPDGQMEKKEKARVEKELAQIKQKLIAADFKKIQNQTDGLKALQESSEDLSVLPTLAISDIPPEVEIVTADTTFETVPATCYRQPTAGIFYLSGACGVARLPNDLIGLVPFFTYALTKMGTTQYDYVEQAQRMDAHTGGVGFSVNARMRFDDRGLSVPFISFGAKCLYRNQDQTAEIMQALLSDFDFSNHKRLKSLLLEYRAQMESMVVHNGHRLALSLASRNFTAAGRLSETWHGVHQLIQMKDLTKDLTADRLSGIAADLDRIGRHVFTKGNCRMAMVGEKAALEKGARLLGQTGGLGDFGRLAGQASTFGELESDAETHVPREGWSTSTAVSFVAQVFKTVRMEHDDSAALSVIAKMLRSLYLHREIREKGGAYGGFALYNPETGLFGFGSYRDPHIVATLAAYAGASDFILEGAYSDEDIKEAVLQVCAGIDKPDTPGAAARKAFFRQIIRLSDDMRTHYKQNLLALTHAKIEQAAERYFKNPKANAAVAVISSAPRLKTANQKLKANSLKLCRI